MILNKHARPTLTAFELDCDDELHFTLLDGTTRRIALQSTRAKIHSTTLAEPRKPEFGAKTVLRMHCQITIDGCPVELVRWVGNDLSFYEPWNLFGMTLWFDAASDLFEHLNEDHGPCRPRKAARFAVQDARARICPVLLHPWCPLPEGGLRISDCYDGSDCWMGPYFGADAHGGLDINHPAGTPIWTPIAIDKHQLFNAVSGGDNNNRWRGFHRWSDGSTWVLQVHHLIQLRVPEHQPLEAGSLLADAAGYRNGSHEHSHFAFKVIEPGAAEEEEIALDPWILFRQMYADRQLTLAKRNPLL